MTLDPRELADELERCGETMEYQLRGVEHAAMVWKPSHGSWSLLEVLVHMADEERFDFRPRLQSILDDPARPWEPIDPEGWVTQRRYNERDVGEALEDFQAQRRQSVAWLRQIREAAWDHLHDQPWPIRAGDLAVAWMAHDHLHIAQMARIRAQWWDRLTTYSTRYASP